MAVFQRGSWALFFLLSPVDWVAGQATLSSPRWSAPLSTLEEALPEWMTEATIPGLSIVVVSADSIWSREFGVLTVDRPDQVGPETVFEAASLSKPVFAWAVLEEVAAGTVELDSPLDRYWEHPDLADESERAQITPRMVLTHRTGLPNWRRDQPLALEFTPGSRFQYSGEGYVYLQRALDAHLGRSLEELVGTRVFEPLGMTRSNFTFDGSDPDHAVPHHSRGTSFEKRPAPRANAAASLHTTALDYGRFVQGVLQSGNEDPERLARIRRDATPVAEGVEWGLGWGLEYGIEGRNPALWHWGDNGPFKAFVYLVPESGVGVAYFANSTNGLSLIQRILGTLFPGSHALLDWLEYDQLPIGLSR